MPYEPTRRSTLTGLVALGLVGCKRAAAPVTPPPTDTDSDDTDRPDDTDTDTGSLDTDNCDAPTGPQTEGPYYPEEPPPRIDVREDRMGVELQLDLEVVAQGSCAPVIGAEVDVWCADAAGTYSGTSDFGTEAEGWLRGQQLTDSHGRVRFTAIVPGSYPGRAVHLHVKVRSTGNPELTTQVYLPDAIVAGVLDTDAYANGAPQTLNSTDAFYDDDTLLAVSRAHPTRVDAEGRLII